MARIKNMKNAKKIENPGVLLKRLMGYIMKHYGAAFVTVLICILISVICNVQGTMFMQTLIDDYIVPMLKDGSRDFSGLAHAITRVAGFYAIGVAVTLLYSQIMVNITQGTLRSLRDDLFTHMQDLPIKYFDTHAHGDIMSVYTNDIDTLRQMISQSIPQIFNSGIMVVSIIVCMLVLSVPLTVVSLAMVGIMVYLSKRIATLSGKYFVQQQKDLGAANGYIEEMMQGQKVVKVFCHEEKSIEEFKELKQYVVGMFMSLEKGGMDIIGEAIKKTGTFKKQIDEYFSLMRIWFRDILVYKATKEEDQIIFQDEYMTIEKMSQTYSFDDINDILKAIDLAESRIKSNVNFDSTIEILLLSIKEKTSGK